MIARWKTAWITGASTGIGREIALILARQGVRVAASARGAEKLAGLARLSPNISPVPVDGTDAAAVVERHCDFGQAQATARRGAVEDDVGHFAAAQRLGALFTEDPADGVNDVALAGPVGPDDGSEPVAEVEDSLLGEAFETDNFEPLEHAASGGGRVIRGGWRLIRLA